MIEEPSRLCPFPCGCDSDLKSAHCYRPLLRWAHQSCGTTHPDSLEFMRLPPHVASLAISGGVGRCVHGDLVAVVRGIPLKIDGPAVKM